MKQICERLSNNHKELYLSCNDRLFSSIVKMQYSQGLSFILSSLLFTVLTAVELTNLEEFLELEDAVLGFQQDDDSVDEAASDSSIGLPKQKRMITSQGTAFEYRRDDTSVNGARQDSSVELAGLEILLESENAPF